MPHVRTPQRAPYYQKPGANIMLHEHPSRRAILEEMHARPIVLLPKVTRLRRLVFLEHPKKHTVPTILKELQNWCQHNGLTEPQTETRQHSFTNGPYQVTWEFHTEFITITWAAPPDDADANPDEIGIEIAKKLELVCASRIDIISDATIPKRLLPGFNLPSLCHATVEDGKAEIITDFVEDDDGFVRLEFAAGKLTPIRRAIIARRLFEIETYSKMALLGLPLIRRVGPELGEMEQAISTAIRRLPDATTISAARAAMETLNQLSMWTARLSETVSYRIATSQAYGTVLSERLASLGERSTGDGSIISRHINNRVGPAVRTILATEKRLDVAANRVERTVAMLNARNGLELEIQNGEILNTISQTAKSQFRLQKTVEGLSTIAISYYLLGIIGYALTGPLYAVHWSKEWTLSLLAPVVLAGVFWTSRRVWRKSPD